MKRMVVFLIMMGVSAFSAEAQQLKGIPKIEQTESKAVVTATPEAIAQLRTNDLVRKVPDVSKMQQQKVFQTFLRCAKARVFSQEGNKKEPIPLPNVVEELKNVLSADQLRKYTEATKAEFAQKINSLKKK